jgi:hypothetical protein
MSETFVDQPSAQLAQADTWHKLSYNQMLDVKNQLLSKVFMARGNQAYLKPLNTALQRIEVMLAAKLNDPRGLS